MSDSLNPPETSSNSKYQAIFDNALAAYKNKTGKDLTSDPLLDSLKSCNTPRAVIDLLQGQIPGFGESERENDRLTRWLNPTVHVLYSLSMTICGPLSLVCPPAGAIFTAIGALLSVVKDVSASQGTLLDIFERIENVFRRLEAYVDLPPNNEMTDIVVKVMAEVLRVLALVTKEIKQGTFKRFLKKVAGRSDIEDALRRLDKLTQEEHRMATAQDLRVTHGISDKVDFVIDVAENQKRDQLLKEIASWFSPPDPFVNLNTASGAHHEGTGKWIIESDVFKEWKESGSLLWIHGKPGAGKTVLTCAIIQDINVISAAGSAHMAMFFFDFKDKAKQDARGLLSSLIVQLSDRSPSFYHILSDFYSPCRKCPHQPSINALTKCLEDLLMAAGDTPVYLILDALDECPNANGLRSSRDEVLVIVKELTKLKPSKLHLCVTSRLEADIRTYLDPLTSASNCISVHEQNGQREDIADFVKAFVYSDNNIRRWRDEDKELVIETLVENADGMFRWIVCQLEVLRHCFPSSLRSVLAVLPKSLDQTYERILQQIPEQSRVHAHRLLQCLTVAVRPLLVDELAEVLAINFPAEGGTPIVDEKLLWEDKEQVVLSACSSLVTIVQDWDSRQVQFSHFSVKEFLTSERLSLSTVDSLRCHHICLKSAHRAMAQACLGVLLQLTNRMETKTIESYPLSRYAGEHFGVHAEFEDVLSHIVDRVDDLLDPDKPHFDTWIWLQIGDWDSERWYDSWMDKASRYPPLSGDTPKYPPRVSPLYYVAALGHLRLARRIVSKRPQDLRTRDDKSHTPLHLAVLARRVEVSQLLIEHTVDLDIWDIENGTLLHMAVYQGLHEVVQTLLKHDGAIKTRLNIRDEKGQTALHLASQYHYLDIMALLLQLNPDVDAQDNDGMTPLLLASQKSPWDVSGIGGKSYAVVQLLLEHGASVHVCNKNGETPLHSSLQHDPSIMTLLFNFGADVDAQDNNGMTPLHSASRGPGPSWESPISDFDTAVRLLLEHGASVHVRNKNGETPLHLASQHDRPSIMAVLLNFGAEVDAEDNNGVTPLQSASRGWSWESTTSDCGPAVQLLLKHGANIHLRNKNGQTPLHIAAERSHPSLMSSLLELGADVKAQDDNGMTPLHSALQGSSWESPVSDIDMVVQMLLERGASVTAWDKDRRTPLHLAAERNYPGLVSSLLKLGAEMEAQDNNGMTPLHSASQGPSWESPVSDFGTALQLLLENDANVDAQNKDGQTPLHLAVESDRLTYVSLLLDSGADVDAQDKDGMTPLHLASKDLSSDSADVRRRRYMIALLLLERGAIVHLQNRNGQTPLHAASQYHLSNIVELLLNFGAEVDAQDHNNMTPLHSAVLSSTQQTRSAVFAGDPDFIVIQLLLRHGANVEVQNNEGETPLQVAWARGEEEFTHLLLEIMQWAN